MNFIQGSKKGYSQLFQSLRRPDTQTINLNKQTAADPCCIAKSLTPDSRKRAKGRLQTPKAQTPDSTHRVCKRLNHSTDRSPGNPPTTDALLTDKQALKPLI